MKKNKNKEEESSLKIFLLKIVDKRIYIFSVLASILFVNIIIYKIKPLIAKKSSEGSFLAHQSYLDWKDSDFKDCEKLKKLKSLIRKDPHLKPKYEGLILQNLLLKNDFGKEENKLANKAFERTRSELPLYHEYSQVAILINDEKYEEALNKSKELKTKMLSDLSFLQGEGLPAGSILYSFNLLRIALLEGKLNNKDEFLAWQELEDYLSLSSPNKVNENIKTASEALKEIFNENDIELIDYILYRKNRLSSIKF